MTQSSFKSKLRILTGLITALGGMMMANAGKADLGNLAILQTLGERHFLIESNRRCHGLSPEVAETLMAAYLQARNESLRLGFSNADIAGVKDRALAASQAKSCTDPDITLRTANANSLYSRFAGQGRMELASHRSRYDLQRHFQDDDAWRLTQSIVLDSQTQIRFGLYGKQGCLRLSTEANFNRPDAPVAARIILRDMDRSPEGIINPTAYGLSPSLPLGYETFRTRSYLAQSHDTDAQSHRFEFPWAALRALGPLDPREDIVIEFLFNDGPQYVRFEIGDFIPGLIYANLPSPYTHNQGHSSDKN